MAKSPKELMEIVVKAADDRLGEDIKALDVKKMTPLADYFVILTARNARQVKALVDTIVENIEKNGYDIKAIEGKHADDWLLIDAIDVIVHVFTHEARETYNLEKLWGDADTVDISNLIQSTSND
ncbi:MAG: ribosome silencing factor [Aerococcus sp.]|nr:ribosome silencing factor [Aerococcus sp.]